MNALIVLGLALALSSAKEDAPAPVSAPAPAPAPVQVRVMTFNIWYGGEQVDFAQVAETIRAAKPDIVGVQEPDANLERLGAAVGLTYVDRRRNILSRWPLFDSGVGERTAPDDGGYGMTALDPDALHAWVMVRPGQVVAMANTHLSSDPSGVEAARAGASADDVRALEDRVRVPEAAPFAGLGALAQRGTPVFLTGDFNTPSHLDWTAAVRQARPELTPYALEWPVTALLAQAGLRDSYREAHPDPVARPGDTWSPGTPPPVSAGVDPMRIDYVLAGGAVRTLDSQLVGEAGGPDVDIPLSAYPSDHRAVVSTFSVAPAPAPALVAAEPSIVTAGDAFLLRFHLPGARRLSAVVTTRGGGLDTALTGVIDEDASYRTAIRLSSLDIPPGEYDVVLAGEDGRVAARTRLDVVDPAERPALTIQTPTVRPGQPLRLRWSGAPGHRHDWLGVFRAGDPSVIAYLSTAYTHARRRGDAQITLEGEDGPLPPGDYEARLMRDDSYVVLARARFTIEAP